MTNYAMRDCLVCENRTMHDGGLCLDCKNNKLNEMIEYMKIHLISLEQDAEMLQEKLDNFEGDLDSWDYEEIEIADMNNTGEIAATQHLLSVANDILNK